MKASLFLALVPFVALCACSRAEPQREKSSMRKVRVSASPLLSWGPIMIAKEEGFFRDEGIDAEFVTTLSSQEEIVALLTGDIDVMPGPPHTGFLSAIAQGAKGRIVAGQGELSKNGCTYYGIVRSPKAGSNRNLRRIRSSNDGFTRFVTDRMLKQAGIDPAHVEVLKLPDAVLAGSLQSGAIEAAATSEPSLTRLRQFAPLWLSGEKALPDFQWGVIIFGERLLSRDRDAGERFLRAYKRGVTQYRQGKTERNIAIIAKETGETPEMIRKTCWLSFRPDIRADWRSLNEFQLWAVQHGLMRQTLSRNQAIDSTFLTQ